MTGTWSGEAGLTTKQLAQNAMAFNILYEGIPVVYYGQEQHLQGAFNPLNREALWLTKYDTSAPLYNLTATLNAVRTQAISANASYLDYITQTLYDDEHTFALRKGFGKNQIITVLTNNGANSSQYNLTVAGTGFAEGDVVQEVIGCTTLTASSSGDLHVVMDRGLPKVFYPVAALKGSKICQTGASSSGGGGSSSGNGGTGGSGTGKPKTSYATRVIPTSRSQLVSWTGAVTSLLCLLSIVSQAM